MFAAQHGAAGMSVVPGDQRGAAPGPRSMFQNSGTSVSVAVLFELMTAGLTSTLPHAVTSGLQQQGVPSNVATQVGQLPRASSLYASFLGAIPT